MEYHSAIKRNGFESAEVRWMNPEPVAQNEVSQKPNTQVSCIKVKMDSRALALMHLSAGRE